MQVIRRIIRNAGIFGLTILLIVLSQSSVFAQAPDFTLTAEDGTNTIKGNPGDIVTLVLKGEEGQTPGYYWGAVQVDFTQGVQEVISVEEDYRNWWNGMGLWWTTASGEPLYYYTHDHTGAEVGPISYNDYLSKGTVDAAAWESEGLLWGYIPGPSASIDGNTIRFYYSGDLGPDKPGIKIQVRLNSTSPITLPINANIFNHTRFEFAWYDWWNEGNSQYDITVDVTPYKNYQAVHNEDYDANVWVGYKGPITATVGEKFSFTTYGQLLLGSGNFWYDIKIVKPGGTVIDIATGVITDRFESTDYTPPDPGEYTVRVTGADQSGHGNGDAVSTEAKINATETKDVYTVGKGPDPTFLNSGEFFHKDFDLTIQGRGFPFQFVREYRAHSNYDGPLGYGWDFNYNARIEKIGDNVKYYTIMRKPEMYPASDLGFVSKQYGNVNISYDAINNWYTVVETDGTTSIFTVSPLNPNYYVLKIITDRNGNKMTFDYGDNPNMPETQYMLLSVTDTLGRSINFYWDENNRISYFKDWTDRRVSFTYDSRGDLVQSTQPATAEYPTGNTTRYGYSNGYVSPLLNHNMLSITDPKLNAYVANIYDDRDRVITQTYGEGYFTFYYIDATETEPKRVFVKDREKNVVEYLFDAQDNVARETALTRGIRPNDPPSYSKTYIHNPSTGSIKTNLPKGNSVEKIWDANNPDNRAKLNLLRIINRDTNNNALTTEFAYEPNFNQIRSITNTLGCGTNFYFDFDETTMGDLNGDAAFSQSNGNIVKITYPVVTKGLAAQGGPQGISPTFQYNEFGQITRSQDPEGYLTDYTYYSSGIMKGYLQSITKDVQFGGARITNSFEYDAVGNIKSISDGYTRKTTFTVNELNQVKEVLSRIGSKIKLYYDANKNLERMEVENKDKDGNPDQNLPWITTTFGYNMMDKLTSHTQQVSAAKNIITLFDYDKNENQKLLTQPETNQVKNIYDERGLLAETIRGFSSAKQSSTRWEYDDNGNPKTVIDGEGNATTFLVDEYDRVYGYVDAMGNRTEQDLDAVGNVLCARRKNAGGTILSETNFLYDELNRNYEVQEWWDTHSVWVITQYEFDANSRVVRMLNDKNQQTTISYNGFNRVVKIQDHLGNKVEYQYDNNMNVLQIKEAETSNLAQPETYINVNQYDANDRLINSTNQQLNATRSYGYDSRNNLTFLRDREGNTTSRIFDGLSRLTKINRDMREGGKGTGGIIGTIATEYQWDDNSRLKKLIDPRGKETVYGYDALNRITSKTLPDSTAKTLDYDRADNLISMIDNNGTGISQIFDDLNRLETRNISRGTNVLGVTSESFQYDGLSRMRRAANYEGSTLVSDVNMNYDMLSRMTSETQQIGSLSAKTIASQFDTIGNRTRLTYPTNKAIDIVPDDLNRISQITQSPNNPIAQYSYVGPWRLKERGYANNTKLTVTYDNNRRITGYSHSETRHRPSLIAGFEYGYDKENNKLFENRTHDNNKGDAYTYDSIYRLTGVKYGVPTLDPLATYDNYLTYASKVDFVFDDSGNRNTVTTTIPKKNNPIITTQTYQVNDLNQYTQVDSQSMGYDPNGNLKEDASNLYYYDYANRLVKAVRKVDSQVIGEYKYDALGRRIYKKAWDETTLTYVETNFYLDGNRVIEECNLSNDMIAQYIHGNKVLLMDVPASSVQHPRSGSFYYHENTQGAIYAVTDDRGKVVERYEYDVYGKVTITGPSGNGKRDHSVIGNPILYAGMRYDAETGFYCYGARSYNPATGRFLQVAETTDVGTPDNETPNNYTHSENNPTNNEIEPTPSSIPVGISPKIRRGKDWGKKAPKPPPIIIETPDGPIEIKRPPSSGSSGGQSGRDIIPILMGILAANRDSPNYDVIQQWVIGQINDIIQQQVAEYKRQQQQQGQIVTPGETADVQVLVMIPDTANIGALVIGITGAGDAYIIPFVIPSGTTLENFVRAAQNAIWGQPFEIRAAVLGTLLGYLESLPPGTTTTPKGIIESPKPSSTPPRGTERDCPNK